MVKEMKLNDLKTGMWVKTRNGDMSLVMRDHISIDDGIFIDKYGYFEFKEYNDDMTDCEFTEYDIIEVFKPDLGNYTLNGDCLISIWKRKQKPELTSFEKEFLKALKPEYRNGYIARDEDGTLMVYSHMPNRGTYKWTLYKTFDLYDKVYFNCLADDSNRPFTWVKWEDEEPWYIPDLLKEA